MRMHHSLGPYEGRWTRNHQETDAAVTFQLPRASGGTGPVSVGMQTERPTGLERRIAAELTVQDLVELRDALDAIIEAERADAAVVTER